MAAPVKAYLAIAAVAVAGFEGLRTAAYLDPVGIPTICFGHTAGVKLGDRKSVEECEALLVDEVAFFGQAIEQAVIVPISQEEYAAYTSFAYNVGVGAFKRSTLLRYLNAGDREAACNQLPRWVYARGIKLPGLVNRRNEERDLCLSGLAHELSQAK